MTTYCKNMRTNPPSIQCMPHEFYGAYFTDFQSETCFAAKETHTKTRPFAGFFCLYNGKFFPSQPKD